MLRQRSCYFLLWFMLLLAGQQWDGRSFSFRRDGPTAAVASESREACDALYDSRSYGHNRLQAILTDGQEAHRICSERPVRLLPCVGQKSGRTLLRWGFTFLYHPRQLRLAAKVRSEKAPFCRPASCEYYVFALRHLRC
ncbi:MAG: hypothetical protein IJ244_02515 [Bacteroidaceae bacterium]|nr:hypothetical protein [Bacteroidaceae bacterium]